jgi:hypothetical protein
MNSNLYFFNDTKQGFTDTNTAVEEFEGDKNFISTSFIRELIQNAIDAVYSSKIPVQLSFRLVDIDKKSQTFLESLHKDTLPLIKCGESLSSKGKDFIYKDNELYEKALVVEEFNTIGLGGEVDRRINDESDWHYSNYMFGRKRASKASGGGSKGVGKITSNLVSELRTVMFITTRSDDDEVWAGGKIEIDKPIRQGDYVFSDVAFLSNNNPIKDKGKDLDELTGADRDKIHEPIKDKNEISLIKDIFQIKRSINTNNSNYGTSWVIPAPLHATADSKRIQKLTSVEQYLKIILSEYSWAIMKELIEIDLDGTLLNKDNIIDLLHSTFPNDNEKWNFFKDISEFNASNEIRLKPDWYKTDHLEESFLFDDDLKKANDIFISESRDLVCLKLPLKINHNGVDQNTHIKLFIQKLSDNDSRSNEMLYRNYLLITNESNSLKNTYGDGINIMLLIDDPYAVNFCRAAERADHLKFVIMQAVKKGYKESSVKENLSAIRSSVKKAYELFNNVELEDKNLFSNIFSIITPLDIEKDKKPRKKKKIVKKKTKISKKSYAGVTQIEISEPKKNELIFKPGSNKIRQNQLPLLAKVKANDYALLSGLNVLNLTDDGFSNIKEANKLNSNIQNKTRDSFEFEITDENFELHIKDVVISRTAKISLEY